MKKKRKESNLLNLLINIVIPTIVLVRFSSEATLGTTWGLIVALAFPIAYGLIDFYLTREYNFFSILGGISIFLTGGIGLFELDPKYVAIKEAGVPLLIALTILLFRNKYPFVKKLLNEVIDQEKILTALKEKNTTAAYEKRLNIGTYLVVASFLLSAVLNFILAKMIVVSQPGTEAFNVELGKLTALSYPVIALPSTIVLMIALIYILLGAAKLTGIELTELLEQKK